MSRYFWLALAVRVAWAWAVPELDAPDEANHVRSVRFFAERLRLASAEEIASGEHGFYIAGSPVPYVPFVVAAKISPSLLALRLAAAFCGALLVLLSAYIARSLFGSHALSAAVPLACAVHPQLAFVTATVSWDVVSILAATALIASWPRLLAERASLGMALLAGALAGLVLLVKPTSFCVLPVHAFVFLRSSWRRPALAIAAAVACTAIAGPFLVHNWRLFPGDPFALTPILHTTAPEWPPGAVAPLNLLFETRYVVNTFESAWGLFGYMSVKLPNAVYAALAASCAYAVYGLARGSAMPRQFALASVATLAIAFAVAYWTNVTNDYQPQGRYYFAAVVPIVSLWLAGLEAPAKRSARRLGVAVVGLAFVTLYSILFLVR